MPHHAHLAVPAGRRRLQSLIHGGVHGAVLVIGGHLLRDGRALRLERHEVPDQVEQAVRGESPLQQHLKPGKQVVGDLPAVDGAPRAEARPVRRQRAHLRFQPVGGDERLVEGEQRRDLVLVGLKLLEGLLRGRGFVGKVLQFEHGDGQAVQKDDDVRAAQLVALLHGELVDGEPVVGGGVCEVRQPHLQPGDAAVLAPCLHVHAVSKRRMEGAVVFDERGAGRDGDLAEGVGQRGLGRVRVDARQGVPQPRAQDDVLKALAQVGGGAGLDLRPEQHLVSQTAQEVERAGLDGVFVDEAHGPPRDCRRTR